MNTEIALRGSDGLCSRCLLSAGLGETDLLATDPDLMRGKRSGETERILASLLDVTLVKEKLGGFGDDSLEEILDCPFRDNGGVDITLAG